MSSTMTIGKRFQLTSGVLLLLSTVLVLIAILGFNSARMGVHSLAVDSIPGIRYSGAMVQDLADMRIEDLHFVLDKDMAEQAKWAQNRDASRAEFAQDMKKYERSIVQDEDRQNFAKVKTQIEAIDASWGKVTSLAQDWKYEDEGTVNGQEFTPQAIALEQQLKLIAEWNNKAANKTIATTTLLVQGAWWLTIVTGVLALVLGVGLAWRMRRALEQQLGVVVRELSTGAEQIASAASQVSSSSQSLAQGSSQQAASIQETSTSTEEINSMAHKNTANAAAMTGLVTDSQSQVVESNRQVGEMVLAMEEINAASGKISKIIKVIDEIAFQTNILALNAAVEAARAGEAGMGFAVVAEEVRNLAQRCAIAAKDTSSLIEDSVSKSMGGKAKLGQVATSIERITERFTQIKTLVDEVSSGSKEQSDGIEQIGKAITRMEKVTQSVASNAEQSTAAAQQLHAQSEALRDVVIRLSSMAGHDVASTGAPSPAASLHRVTSQRAEAQVAGL